MLNRSIQWIKILGIIGTLTVSNIVVRIILLLYKRHRDIRALKDFSGPKPTLLFGNVTNAIKQGKTHLQVKEWAKTYKDAFIMHLGLNNRILMIVSPKAIKAIMSTSEPKNDILYPLVKPWIGNGLVLSSGKVWARNRRLLTPSFHFGILKPYQLLFSHCTNTMLNKWESLLRESPEDSIEMFEHVSLMTFSCLMKCIFGIDNDIQNTGENNTYVKTVNELADLTLNRFRNPFHHNNLIYYLSVNGYRFRRACRIAHGFSTNVIAKKRKEKLHNCNNSEKEYLDFIDILLACRDTNGNGLTDKEIQAEVDTFMFAGHDTTASGISWCLYNLACHPEYQKKCRKEVCEVLGDENVVDWGDLPNLTYLTKCIKESLRTHPPVPGIGRKITSSYTLYDGRFIPAGTTTFFNIYSCHMNPEYWPNPEVFDPERFSTDATKDRHPYAFIPFSAGPRNCIGQHFAMNELKTNIALILKRFQFDVDQQRIPEQHQSLVLRSTDGIWLKVKQVV